MVRVLVCGGRDYANRERVFYALNHYDAKHGPITHVITGDAPGADSLANAWARERSVPLITRPADWLAHGRAAGPIRNQAMLDEDRPDVVLAFPGGRGTADMVRRAAAAGITVHRIPR